MVAGDSGYEKFIFVLEVIALYLKTDNPENICERVTTTAFQEL